MHAMCCVALCFHISVNRCWGALQASLVAAEMQALAMQLSAAMCAKSGGAALAEWSAVAAEAWACIEAETLVAKASPLSPPPPPAPRRLQLECVSNQCNVCFCPAVLSTAHTLCFFHELLQAPNQ
jgi:hypothetical protein